MARKKKYKYQIGDKLQLNIKDQLEHSKIKGKAFDNIKGLFDKADALNDMFNCMELYFNDITAQKAAWWTKMEKKYKLKDYEARYYTEGFMLILDIKEDK